MPKLDFEAMTKVACSLRQLDHKCPSGSKKWLRVSVACVLRAWRDSKISYKSKQHLYDRYIYSTFIIYWHVKVIRH